MVMYLSVHRDFAPPPKLPNANQTISIPSSKGEHSSKKFSQGSTIITHGMPQNTMDIAKMEQILLKGSRLDKR
jgi:hypothetical protein